MAKTSKATIADVARLAGVSTATAGRVLGRYGYTREETRQQVLQAAAKLGYRTNALARSLITGKTRTIGVVAGDIQNPFYASILRGIADVVERRDFGLLIVNSDESLDKEIRAVDLLLEKQVDGLIVSPCDTRNARHLRDLHSGGLPLLLLDRSVAGLEVDRVGIDNIAAAERAVGVLIAAGHRRIGLVGEMLEEQDGGFDAFIARGLAGEVLSTDTLYPSWQRLLGYLRAHRQAGMAVDASLIRRVGAYSAQAAREVARTLIARPDRPSAVFATDGTMSEGVIGAVTEAGLVLPDALSLVCFDDLDWMSFLSPGISTMAQPRLAMGETAASMLLERIEGSREPMRTVVMRADFVERGSIAAAPAC
ncbi:LacI family DNA-binding transcriptional regulator [Aquibium microcysteis]|uniref:LacI family DNA-binding transcriptional regulator n=1 Tax=Aquibium microcysteis TaxID=675281 RepID=UPI00165CF887|nr:LacI family DNA-binding transcriptional regulator [Aquibium microcysteis]